MMIFTLRDEYIKLGQLLKAVGFVDSGVDAKELIQAGEVLYNGEVVLQRGKKCYDGDVISFQGQDVQVKSGEKE